ncbi:MAG: hypothetical protein Q8R12_03600 [bacterium]|nr:hypothetical protein [bacterium]
MTKSSSRKRTRQSNFLFALPFGESAKFPMGNRAHCTQEAIQCGLCGTKHPKHHVDDWSYHTFTFLGRQGVVECCGRIADVIFGQWGSKFTERRLEEFTKNPLCTDFHILRGSIKDVVSAWSIEAQKQLGEVQEAAASLPAGV